jgi:site-specific DNA-cytosine methylase
MRGRCIPLMGDHPGAHRAPRGGHCRIAAGVTRAAKKRPAATSEAESELDTADDQSVAPGPMPGGDVLAGHRPVIFSRGEIDKALAQAVGRNPSEAEPLPVDPPSLSSFCRRILLRLTPLELRGLLSMWRLVGRVGTQCSGTDAPVLALRALGDAIASVTEKHTPRFEHVFSCERIQWKRDFIRQVFPDVKCLFHDVGDMLYDRAICMKSGVTTVPSPDILLAGFPCVDVSSRNPNASRFRRVVSEGGSAAGESGGTTGRVFQDILAFSTVRQVPFVLMENVTGLLVPPKINGKPSGPSNFSVCVSALEEAGRIVNVWHLSPLMFGVPQTRPRLWFAAVQLPVICERMGRTMSEGMGGEVSLRMKSIMAKLVGHTQTSLNEFMVREVDTRVTTSIARAVRHEAIPSTMDRQLVHMLPGLATLSPRQWGILEDQDRRTGLLGKMPEERPRTIDISQTVNRASLSQPGVCHTWTPKSCLLHTGRGRPMLGVEGLRLQNIRFNDDLEAEAQLLSRWSNEQLSDLAGNAFQGNCCVAAVVAMLAAVGMVLESTTPPGVFAASSMGELGELQPCRSVVPYGDESTSSCSEGTAGL